MQTTKPAAKLINLMPLCASESQAVEMLKVRGIRYIQKRSSGPNGVCVSFVDSLGPRAQAVAWFSPVAGRLRIIADAEFSYDPDAPTACDGIPVEPPDCAISASRILPPLTEAENRQVLDRVAAEVGKLKLKNAHLKERIAGLRASLYRVDYTGASVADLREHMQTGLGLDDVLKRKLKAERKGLKEVAE